MSDSGPCRVLQHVSNWASECTQETYSVAAAWRWTLSKPLEDNTMASIKTLNGLIRTIQTLQPRTEQFMRGSTFVIVGLKSMQNRLTVGHQLWKYTQLSKRCFLDRDIQPGQYLVKDTNRTVVDRSGEWTRWPALCTTHASNYKLNLLSRAFISLPGHSLPKNIQCTAGNSWAKLIFSAMAIPTESQTLKKNLTTQVVWQALRALK